MGEEKLKEYLLRNIKEVARGDNEIVFNEPIDGSYIIGEREYPAVAYSGMVLGVRGDVIFVLCKRDCSLENEGLSNEGDWEVDMTLDEFIDNVAVFV